jgi:osomolarity two-component system, response regulator SSK1
MTGARLPVVRIPSVISGQGGGEETLGEEPVVVELSSSNKFGIAWPAEQPPQVPLLASERPVALSSSEGETDVSEEESTANPPHKRNPRPEDFADESDFITPTNTLNLEQNPMDQAGRLAVPRLFRAFSMPLPSQLSALQNPRRTSVSEGASSPVSNAEAPELEHFRELSLELADSVQMVIQTLLQLSPPQVLDPAKEQFSACSLSIPTPSISAMFTTMKNLNYMSANMSQLSCESHGSDSPSPAFPAVQTGFDVGEMLQSVGDAVSGVAAQAGVDLVLFHSDVGMKHVAVKGDESGLSYTLSHVRFVAGFIG